MWKQRVFSEQKSAFWGTTLEANEKLLEKTTQKALDWINAAHIQEFKISHNMMYYSYASYYLQITVVVTYKEP